MLHCYLLGRFHIMINHAEKKLHVQHNFSFPMCTFCKCCKNVNARNTHAHIITGVAIYIDQHDVVEIGPYLVDTTHLHTDQTMGPPFGNNILRNFTGRSKKLNPGHVHWNESIDLLLCTWATVLDLRTDLHTPIDRWSGGRTLD